MTIIAWRNIRAIFGVLRRREMLGLLVDWGYRPDGIPVRLFGAWTALPAGPATLAAKTGSRILPITIRRQPGRHVRRQLARARSTSPRPTRPSSSARPRRSPTRWPRTSPRPRTSGTASSRSGRRPPAETADLERRATLMQAGIADPGPGAGVRPDRWPRHRAAALGRGSAPLLGASWLACRLPEGSARAVWPSSPATSGIGPRPTAPPRHAGTCGGWPIGPGRATVAGSPASAPPRPTRARSSGSSGSPTGTPRATTSRSRGARRCARPTSTERMTSRRLRSRRGVRRARRSIFVGLHFGSHRAAGDAPRDPGRRAPSRRWRRSTTPTCRPGSSARAAPSGIRIVGLREARRELLAALRDGTSVGLVGDRDLTGGGMPDRALRRARPAAPRPGDARGRERRPALRRRGAAGRRRALPRAARARRRAGGRHAARARDRDDGRDRARLRAHHRGRARAVVGGLLPDLARPRGRRGCGAGRTARRTRPTARAGRRPREPSAIAREAGADARRRPAGAPTCTSTPSPRTAPPTSSRSSTTSRRADDLDVIAITDHERIDAAVAARAMAPRPRPAGRRRRRRGGHDAGWPPARAVDRSAHPAVPLAAHDDRGGPRRRRPRRPGASARPLPAVRPGLGAAPAARRPRRSLSTRRRSRPSTRPRSGDRGTTGSCASPTRHGLAGVGNSDAHAARRDRHRLDDLPGPQAADLRRRSRPGDPPRRRVPRHAGKVGVFGRQMRSGRATPGTRCRTRSARRDRPRPRLSRRSLPAPALRPVRATSGR